MIKVGIPRAFGYFYYYPMYKAFFDVLGIETIVSQKTNKVIIDTKTPGIVQTTCLPLKAFEAHMVDLADKADFIFVPRYISIHEGQYCCPKLNSYTETTKCIFKHFPKLINPTIDTSMGKNKILRVLFKVGLNFTNDVETIGAASRRALDAGINYKNLILSGAVISDILDNGINKKPEQNNKSTILLLGEPQMLYDEYLNMDIIGKVRSYGYDVITCDNFDVDQLTKVVETYKLYMHSTQNIKNFGSVIQCINDKNVVGIIYVFDNSCGVDKSISENIKKTVIAESNMPYSTINCNEYSTNADVNIKIETFIDTVKKYKWGLRNEETLSWS